MIYYINLPESQKIKEVSRIPIRTSYLALKKTKAITKRSFTKSEDDDYDLHEELFYQSLCVGYKYAGEENPFTRKDMPELLDLVYMDFVELVPKFFEKKKKEVAPVKEEDAEKK